jgi:hypothetical protein
MKTRRTAVLGAILIFSAFAGADPATRRSFLVRISDIPAAKAAIDAFRSFGFRVDVWHGDTITTTSVPADHPVIAVGSDVPVDEAVEVIRIARQKMPSLTHVFIQEDPTYAKMIYVAAHKDWIPVKRLKPLKDADFAAITAKGQSRPAFHANVRRFGL